MSTPTTSEIEASQRIYNQAIAGSDNNPGLPATLANFLVGQSANETAGWTSDFFVNNNNCFGYSCDSGSQYQDGCSAGNADNGVQVGNYDSIEDSTKEIVDWIYRRVSDGKFPSDLTTITSADQYATLLKNAGYYQSAESSYAANISAWLSKLGNVFLEH
jgi:uncharacterized FlgJ-related protein